MKVHEYCGCPFLYSTCTPPVFVFSALNNSHYFPLYSMTRNLVNSLHRDLLSGTAITCLCQKAHGLFISVYHIRARRVCYSNLYPSPAIPGIPWHGSWCFHSQILQLEIQNNQLLRNGKRERPAPRSRVLLEKQIVAQCTGHYLRLYGTERFIVTSTQYNTHNIFC